MRKAADLRDYLAGAVPSLEKNPDRLVVYIPKGAIACRAGSLSFEWRYDVEITVIEFADHPDTLIVPLLAWISLHQPDLLQNPERADSAIRFEAEVVDHDKADVQLTVSLSERVVVRAKADGYDAVHCDDTAPDDIGVIPWRLFIKGVEVVPGA
jgi:hypothetical protein